MLDISIKIKMVKRIESDYIAIYKLPSNFKSEKEEYLFRNEKSDYVVSTSVNPNQDLAQISLPPNIENGKYVCKYISYISKPIGGAVLTCSNQFEVVDKITELNDEIQNFKKSVNEEDLESFSSDFGETLNFCPNCKSLQLKNAYKCSICETILK